MPRSNHQSLLNPQNEQPLLFWGYSHSPSQRVSEQMSCTSISKVFMMEISPLFWATAAWFGSPSLANTYAFLLTGISFYDGRGRSSWTFYILCSCRRKEIIFSCRFDCCSGKISWDSRELTCVV